MLKNYFTVTLRHLWNHKQITLINIVGLSVGMAVCILMLLFVQDELSYDLFHEKGENIYRIEIGVGVFATAGVVALVIAWLTVGYQSVKAAQANPVNSLRKSKQYCTF
jgi:ABC-type lipoprotein release transport system permease subunit